MKKIVSGIGIFAMLFILASCGGGIKGDKVESGEAMEEQIVVGDKLLEADLAESNVEWVGKKPTGQHNGTVELKEGRLELSEGKLIGGSFTMDMKSIKVLDLTDPKMNGDLRGHLSSPDFFSVDSFPTATFVITGAEEIANPGLTHKITGNLTIKGITRSISFDANVRAEENKLIATTPQFIINRAEWNVRYGSKSFFNNLKDNFINDDIGLKINLTATL
ncbi:MAG: YceI family protein [Bacteroidales bacterium]